MKKEFHQQITILSQETSLVNHIIAQLRDEVIQKDRHRFRFNMERLGEILAFEISKRLSYTTKTITTPLGLAETPVLSQQPVVCSILRAAIVLQQGFLRMFDEADTAFISAYRFHTYGDSFSIKIEYSAAPDLSQRNLILLDPMIATGSTMYESYKELLKFGEPKHIFLCGVIASEEGLDYLVRHFPDAQIMVCAVDNELTAKGYIVPGLGDAGDLAFGPKA